MNELVKQSEMSKDRINVSKETDKNGKESISYSKSWDKDGMHHNLEVKKVEGGYIISESKYGNLPKEGDEGGEYIDERSERVSTTNPFKDKEEKELDGDDKMFGFVDNPTF